MSGTSIGDCQNISKKDPLVKKEKRNGENQACVELNELEDKTIGNITNLMGSFRFYKYNFHNLMRDFTNDMEKMSVQDRMRVIEEAKGKIFPLLIQIKLVHRDLEKLVAEKVFRHLDIDVKNSTLNLLDIMKFDVSEIEKKYLKGALQPLGFFEDPYMSS